MKVINQMYVNTSLHAQYGTELKKIAGNQKFSVVFVYVGEKLTVQTSKSKTNNIIYFCAPSAYGL